MIGGYTEEIFVCFFFQMGGMGAKGGEREREREREDITQAFWFNHVDITTYI